MSCEKKQLDSCKHKDMSSNQRASDLRKKKFLDELIELQIKHEVILEGYEIDIWTKENGEEAKARHEQLNPGKDHSDYLVSEEMIRARWENQYPV